MLLETDKDIAIVVNRTWANLAPVRLILRDRRDELGGSDSGHMIIARIRDGGDPLGLWIDNSGQREANPEIPLKVLFIPWNQVFMIAISEGSVSEWKKHQRIGAVSDLT